MATQKLVFSGLIGASGAVAYLLKKKYGGETYTKKTRAAVNKVVIVTGSSYGIGKATAYELARRRARIVLACRDMKKCENVKMYIMHFTKNQNVKCLPCDLSSQDSIKNFVHLFNQEYDRLDILINNAGTMEATRSATAEGIEMDLGVNYLGHFLLTNLLLEKLKNSAPSRVINLLNMSYKKGCIKKDDLNSVKNYDMKKAYDQSQLAIAFFTTELARKLKDSGVTVNAVYPGVVRTKLLRNTSYYKSYLATVLIKPIAWLVTKNDKQGAQPVIYAAIDQELKGISGQLIREFSYDSIFEEEDLTTSKWLWTVGSKWTKLSTVT